MKQLLLAITTLAISTLSAHAQCNKSVQLQTSRTQFLNASYEVKGSKDEKVVIYITKTTITIKPNGSDADALTGTIKESTCDWKVPFKEGKMVIKTDLVDPSGEEKQATITIEAKDGKVTLLAEAKERPDEKMRLEVSSFEEKD
jgi:hypothetical protein